MAAPMPSQIMPQQQTTGVQQQAQPQQQQGDPDPISRFKALLPRLRESVATLFKDSAYLLRQNASHDSGSQPDSLPRDRMEKFERRLEDVFSLIDQIEMSLRLGLELHHQALDSLRNTPQSVIISKPEPSVSQPDGQSYAQYLTTMRQQISFAKELHDMLNEAGDKLHEKSMPQPPPPSQQQQQLPQQQQQD
ncbi:hypothetical protein ACOMHN_050898 [Nucella lapillus]